MFPWIHHDHVHQPFSDQTTRHIRAPPAWPVGQLRWVADAAQDLLEGVGEAVDHPALSTAWAAEPKWDGRAHPPPDKRTPPCVAHYNQ
ncbi:hypothetical protein [Streptomyces sp. NPDC052015]|uniref:hypothetical protein n=1 Tax=Streptomyces sp. NPDC052015 TaxID=3154755 RepID=UPI00341B15FB